MFLTPCSFCLTPSSVILTHCSVFSDTLLCVSHTLLCVSQTLLCVSHTLLCVFRQMEKDIEERLRQKYALIDRTDPSAIQAAQQVTVIYRPLLIVHEPCSGGKEHIYFVRQSVS